MGIAPKAREPGLSLEKVIKDMDAQPRTAEAELALADFMMLPQQEQVRVVFLGLLQNTACTQWCIDMINSLDSRRRTD